MTTTSSLRLPNTGEASSIAETISAVNLNANETETTAIFMTVTPRNRKDLKPSKLDAQLLPVSPPREHRKLAELLDISYIAHVSLVLATSLGRLRRSSGSRKTSGNSD